MERDLLPDNQRRQNDARIGRPFFPREPILSVDGLFYFSQLNFSRVEMYSMILVFVSSSMSSNCIPMRILWASLCIFLMFAESSILFSIPGNCRWSDDRVVRSHIRQHPVRRFFDHTEITPRAAYVADYAFPHHISALYPTDLYVCGEIALDPPARSEAAPGYCRRISDEEQPYGLVCHPEQLGLETEHVAVVYVAHGDLVAFE